MFGKTARVEKRSGQECHLRLPVCRYDGLEIVILLGGGTKHSQQGDISKAIECWRDYKKRKGGR